MRAGINFVAATFVAVLVVLGATIFTVDQRQHAIVFQLGEVREVIEEPGLYFKWPLIQNVRYFDKRILTLDSAEPERFITSEKKNVLVDSFTKWRIIDPKLYYISVGGDESRAKTRLTPTCTARVRADVGQPLTEPDAPVAAGGRVGGSRLDVDAEGQFVAVFAREVEQGIGEIHRTLRLRTGPAYSGESAARAPAIHKWRP